MATSNELSPAPYVFRGKEISGPHACMLLRAILLVRSEAPNATDEEIAMLARIEESFGEAFSRDIARARDEHTADEADEDDEGDGDDLDDAAILRRVEALRPVRVLFLRRATLLLTICLLTSLAYGVAFCVFGWRSHWAEGVALVVIASTMVIGSLYLFESSDTVGLISRGEKFVSPTAPMKATADARDEAQATSGLGGFSRGAWHDRTAWIVFRLRRLLARTEPPR